MSVAPPSRTDPSKVSGLKPLTLGSGPRPLQLQSSALSSPSSTPSSSRFPPQASPSRALSRSNSTNSAASSKRPIPKRLSSISYNPVSSDAATPGASSSSSSYASPLRSAPLLEEPRRARPSSFHAGMPGLSLGPSVSATAHSSNASDGPGPSPSNAEQPKQPAAQTLTEKHADLLRFIAAKESKCLELRTQLEQHEAELAVLKKKWERIVSKAKAKEHAAGTSSSGPATAAGSYQGTHQGTSSGDVVVEALMGVGRYLGGLGLTDDGSSNLAAPKPLQRDRSTSSLSSSVSTSPPNSAVPLEEVIIPPAEVHAGVKPRPTMVGRAATVAGSPNASRGHKRHIYSSKGSNGSITSSPSSSTVPSARASLSSVSTSMSSFDATMTPGRDSSTPVDRFDASSHLESLGMSPELDKSGSGLPWMAIPGLNKKWEQINKGSGLNKQAKRASLLLSDVTDMSNSILGSLSSVLLSPSPSPSGNGPSPKPEIMTPTRTGRARPTSMYASSHMPAPTFSAVKTSPSPSTTRSLLDEEDDDFGFLSKPILPSGATITPKSATAAATKTITQQAKKDMAPADADDDWNW